MEKTSRRWTEVEVRLLKAIYPENPTEYVAMMLHRSTLSIKGKAYSLGLKKTPEVFERQRKIGQFRKGRTSEMKGKRWSQFMSEEGQANSRKTCFKKGEVKRTSPTFRPAGYECVRREKCGRFYIWIKPEIGRRMMPKHRWIWEQANGPIPKGWNVQFKDGDTMNCELSNLYIIPRSKQLHANRAKMSDEQRKDMYDRIYKTRMKAIRRDKRRLLYGMKPLGRLVKNP